MPSKKEQELNIDAIMQKIREEVSGKQVEPPCKSKKRTIVFSDLLKGFKVRGFIRDIVLSSYKIPIAGYIIQLIVVMLRLPTLKKSIQEHESKINRKADVMALYRLKEQVSNNDREIMEMKRIISNKAESDTLQSVISEIASILSQLKDHKLNILDQQQRLSLFLDEVVKGFHPQITSRQADTMIKEKDHIFDAMYSAFEDRFRGTRQDIKGRLEVYLPYVKEVGADDVNIIVLDVGSGRGEWLELLKENGIKATGIDMNRVMVRQCVELGLDVIEDDALEYLRKQKSGSIGIISGFHIIEHLPFHKMVGLFDESLRVLRPGGMIIFETPNPENLIVGACNFYMDPTHRRPLNPEPIKFIAEQRGFADVTILRLHKMREMIPTGQDLTDEVLRRCTMEQDFSVIGYKK